MNKLILLLLMFSAFSYSADKNKKLSKVLRGEIELLDKLIKKSRNRRPDLLYRKLEIYSEQLKIIKDKENQDFISQKQKGKGRDDYFKESKRLYDESIRLGRIIIKRFPGFNRIGEIYFTLALNSRDYKDGKITKHYLIKTLQNAKGNSSLIYAANASLADFYYNQKQFKRAIPYYRLVINNHADNWNTKYRYNYAWCLIKAKKYSSAIQAAKRVFYDSKNKRYINMSEQVLDNIGLFYALDNRVEEGADFYIKEVKRPVKYMIRMSKHLQVRGLFKLTESTLQRAFKHTKTAAEKWDIHFSFMGLYEEYKSISKYFNHAVKAYNISLKNKIAKDNKEEYKHKLVNYVSNLQKVYTDKVYSYSEDSQKQIMKHLVKYFTILAHVEPKKAGEYYFHIGNTYAISKYYPESMKAHYKALSLQKKNKKDKTGAKKTLNAMLAVLGEFKETHAINKKYLVRTYANYIHLFPRDEVSLKIYPNYYNYHFKHKKFDSAYKVVQKFNKNYPENIKQQKEMFTNIVDHFIEGEKPKQLNKWLGIAQKSSLKFSPKYLVQMETTLGAILFKKGEQLMAKKQNEKAIEHFTKLYENKIYPLKIRGKSAYQISLLHYEEYRPFKSEKWFNKSWEMLKDKSRSKMITTLYNIAIQYFDTMKVDHSIKTFTRVNNIICRTKHKIKEDSYKRAMILMAINDDLKSAVKNIKRNQCAHSDKLIAKIEDDIFERMKQTPTVDGVNVLYSYYKKDKQRLPFFLNEFEEQFKNTKIGTRKYYRFAKKMKRIYTIAGMQDKLDAINVMEDYLKFEKLMRKKGQKKLILVHQKINQKSFEKGVDRLLAGIGNFQSEIDKYIQTGHSAIITKANILMMDHYQYIYTQLKAQKYQVKSKELNKFYRIYIGKITEQIQGKVNQIAKESKHFIAKNQILERENLLLWRRDFAPQYDTIGKGLVADRY